MWIRRVAMLFNWRRRREEKVAAAEAQAFRAEQKKKAMDGFATMSGLQKELETTTEKIDLDRLETVKHGAGE